MKAKLVTLTLSFMLFAPIASAEPGRLPRSWCRSGEILPRWIRLG